MKLDFSVRSYSSHTWRLRRDRFVPIESSFQVSYTVLWVEQMFQLKIKKQALFLTLVSTPDIVEGIQFLFFSVSVHITNCFLSFYQARMVLKPDNTWVVSPKNLVWPFKLYLELLTRPGTINMNIYSKNTYQNKYTYRISYENKICNI